MNRPLPLTERVEEPDELTTTLEVGKLDYLHVFNTRDCMIFAVSTKEDYLRLSKWLKSASNYYRKVAKRSE